MPCNHTLADGHELPLSRRQLLQLSGFGGSALLAGCASNDSDNTGNDNGNGNDSDNGNGTGPDDENETTNESGNGNSERNEAGKEKKNDSSEYINEEGPREVIQVAGTGGGYSGSADEGHFYYDDVSGDFDVAVHCTDIEESVEGLSQYRVAGLMVRDSLDPAAPMVYLRRDPDGEAAGDVSPTWITWRAEQDSEATYVDATNAEWLRLTREGKTLTLYGSMTSTDWEQVDQFAIHDDIDLGEDVQVGLAATRNEDGAEQEIEATVTATYKDLTGFKPSESVDIGEPNFEGSVETHEDVPHVTTLEPDTESDDGQLMTLTASVYLPEETNAEYSFEYRQFADEEWTTTETHAISETGVVALEIDVETRRVYLVRARADVPDSPDEPLLTTGTTLFRASETNESANDQSTSFSPGVSHFGLEDGFADPAPWLDDGTPIITITEPTREALFEAFHVPVERLIVFETSGVVDLEGEQLSIRSDRCYVAGQTAPSPGITFINAGLQIAADNCVVQHIRCRPGDYEGEDGWGPTSLQVQDTRENNVVDHCTTTWGIDENLTIGGETDATTYSNNLIAEALRNSTHSEGEHSMGSLINPNAKNVALLGNIWTHNLNRNPRLRLATTSVVVNNLTYNFNDGCWMDPQARSSFVGNLYRGPRNEDQPVVVSKSLDYGEGIPKAYLKDNTVEGNVPIHPADDSFEKLDDRPLWPEGLEALPSEDVREHNLDNVGARPADRTHHDQRVVGLVENEEGDLIDSQEEVGGYPDLKASAHTLELPDSETRTWLRKWSETVEAR